jgi:4-amino-4-deoxy-L-arabinose transferase-like glycosyltransferase
MENEVKQWHQRESWILGCFILASGFILFFNLWGRSIENHGYTRYAEIAREMIRSGEWIVPHYNGEIFIDKTPLLFWLIAIPSWIYGSVTPLIARLPSFFSAWIGSILLYLWGKKVYGNVISGLIAGGAFFSCYQTFFQSRLAKTDILVCFFILLSLYFFYLGFEAKGRKPSLFFGLSFFSMGLGTLTKGPFGLFIPLLIIAAFLIKESRWRLLYSREFLWGYAIFIITICSWFLPFLYRVGVHQYFVLIKENTILTRRAPVYFYFIQIWGQFFPWSLLIPLLAVCLWRKRATLWSSRESFFLLWFAVLFVLLSIFKFKTSRYLLPALPPLALMIGGMARQKFSYFIIFFLFAVVGLHSFDFQWAKKDLSHSPGMVLTRELRPLVKDTSLAGYQLDPSTVEEINFYFDPPTPLPLLKGPEALSFQLNKKEKMGILMTKVSFESLRNQENISLSIIKEFSYKKGKLVLVSDEAKPAP